MSFLDAIAYFRLKLLLNKRPLDINVETYAFCPLKCVFCCNRKYDRKRNLMSLRLFEKIVREYCILLGGGAIGIGSMQSDFLSDPLLMERIKILKRYKKNLYIYSTTPLITASKYSDEDLVEILKMFDYLEISIEGHDEESYAIMGGIKGFNTFREQLSRIEQLIKKNNISCYLKFAFRTNDKYSLYRSEIYKHVKLCYGKNIDIKNTFFSWFRSINKEELPSGTKLIIKENTAERVNCAVPYATLAVQASGKVVGCGCIDWLDKYVIGDCKRQNLKDIWKSHKAYRFRNAFRLKKLPSICRECGLYISVTDAFARERLLHYKPLDGLYYNV